MNIEKIIQELNYSECLDELTCFYYTDATHVQYVGVYSEGLNLCLWNSEEESFDDEVKFKEYLIEELKKHTSRLSKCINSLTE